jgi:hypothetical protein
VCNVWCIIAYIYIYIWQFLICFIAHHHPLTTTSHTNLYLLFLKPHACLAANSRYGFSRVFRSNKNYNQKRALKRNMRANKPSHRPSTALRNNVINGKCHYLSLNLPKLQMSLCAEIAPYPIYSAETNEKLSYIYIIYIYIYINSFTPNRYSAK